MIIGFRHTRSCLARFASTTTLLVGVASAHLACDPQIAEPPDDSGTNTPLLCDSDLQCTSGICSGGVCLPSPQEEDAGILDDAGVTDAGNTDAGNPDAGISDDAGVVDAGNPDAGNPENDAGVIAEIDAGIIPPADAGNDDAGIVDAGNLDAGIVDAGNNDAGVANDAGVVVGGGEELPRLPVDPGFYRYTRIPVQGGMGLAATVAIHPSGDYAIIAESSKNVLIYNFLNNTTSKLSLGNNVRFDDLAFSGDGSFALLVGTDGTNGLLFRFDDSAYRAGATDAATLFPRVASNQLRTEVRGVKFGWNDDPNAAVILSVQIINVNSKISALFSYARTPDNDGNLIDTSTFITAANLGATGGQDVALVKDFFGDTGAFVIGGENGADAFFYSVNDGLISDVGTNNFSNLFNTDQHPSHEYALAIAFTGKIHRFTHQGMNDGNAAFAANGAIGITFAPDGKRAMLYGSAIGNAMSFFEYRHPAYEAAELNNVSVAFSDIGVIQANGIAIRDAAWRVGCDGGLLVGGKSDFNGSTGFIVLFEREGGVACAAANP